MMRVGRRFGGNIDLPGEPKTDTTETGFRPRPEDRMKYMTRRLWVDTEARATILDIRNMDVLDPRVKKIHRRTSAALVKGGLKLQMSETNTAIVKIWDQFSRRLFLDKRQKLVSDARGYVMEGNLPTQWVLDQNRKIIVAAVRMPSETIVADVDVNGVFIDISKAYKQIDYQIGNPISYFALWQLTIGRLDPWNYDDHGSMGRPYLDATRTIWQKLRMTEEDLVIRRHERAPLQRAHSLDGASVTELEEYIARDEKERAEGKIHDYYSNKKLAVTSLQGDENLDHTGDIELLINAFFAGAPAPAGLFGYGGDLKRDILEDLRRDFFDELDELQDEISMVYQTGFELELLLNGINPEDHDVQIIFAERNTETPTQRTDRALKQSAIGASQKTVWETAGLDPATELARRQEQIDSNDPYPEDVNAGDVKITPGNAPKKDSATSISNP